MCGRFAQYSSSDSIQEYFGTKDVTCDIAPSYNIAPTHDVHAVICRDSRPRIGKLRWGITPSWNSGLIINARAETLSEKPFFRTAFQKRRCLIIGDGFYEWKKQGKHRQQPWYFSLASGEPIAFAGIWEAPNERSDVFTCAVITCKASESVREIHSRMPVILTKQSMENWLNPDLYDSEKLTEILMHCHVREFRSFPVDSAVSSVRCNSPECIIPLDQRTFGI
ncbi:MAG: SOS response-associated peptidase [Desulfobacterales bacterium]|nr:SOS response-associated peptidase [Desulfobacterales bacterium]